jgi:hypothetical protein
MVTINDDDSSQNKNILIIDQIQLLIDDYQQKQISKKDIKNQLNFYAKSSGFINNLYRKQAWNLLINSSFSNYSTGILIIII